MAEPAAQFGPWADGIDPAERLARTRCMRVLAMVFARPHADLIATLRDAEHNPAALSTALDLLDALPALPRRRIIATFAALGRTVR